MADSLFNEIYNPDVLSCLANLSNDEVFTPPEVLLTLCLICCRRSFSAILTQHFLTLRANRVFFYEKLQKGLSADLKCKFPTCRNA